MNQKNVKPIFNEIISTVGERTFGELAFLFVMSEEEELGNGIVYWGHGVEVTFDGPFAGKLFLAITPETMEHISANMLGIELGEEPPAGVNVEDGLKELSNVICGNLLPAIAGDEVVFNIESPQILSNPQPVDSIEGYDLVGCKKFELDFGLACIWLFVDQKTLIKRQTASQF